MSGTRSKGRFQCRLGLYTQRSESYNCISSLTLLKRPWCDTPGPLWYKHVQHFWKLLTKHLSHINQCAENMWPQEAWRKVNMTRLTQWVRAVAVPPVGHTCKFWHTRWSQYKRNLCDQSHFRPLWRGVRPVKWQEGRSASTSRKTDRGDTGRLGDRPGPFAINKTCSIPSVITGSSILPLRL